MHTRDGRALETPWAWGLSFLGAVVVGLLGAAVGGTGHRAVMVAVFAVLAAATAAAASFAAAPLVAGTIWCFYDGFFVNRHGQLAVRPATDLRPLALLAVAAVLGWAAGHVVRRYAGRPVRTGQENTLRRLTDDARERLRRRRTRLFLLAAALGIGVGVGAYAQEAAAAAAARSSGHQVTAATEAAADLPASRGPRGGGTSLTAHVPARWQFPAGVSHETTVAVLRGSPPGTRVTLWVDRSGNPAEVPAGAADLLVSSAFVALAGGGGGALLVAAGAGLALRRLDRRDWQAWERDWARVEPDWSGRRRNYGVS